MNLDTNSRDNDGDGSTAGTGNGSAQVNEYHSYDDDIDLKEKKFLDKLRVCCKLIKEREKEIDKLKREEIPTDVMGEPNCNFDLQRAQLEKFVAKKQEQLEQVVQKFFKGRKERFAYFNETKPRSQEVKGLVKYLNKFLNDNAGPDGPALADVSTLTTVAQYYLNDVGSENVPNEVNLDKIVKELAEEAVGNLRKSRIEHALNTRFNDLPPDPADSDPELLAKLTSNTHAERLASDMLVGAFCKDSKVYIVEDDDDVSAGTDDEDSPSESEESEILEFNDLSDFVAPMDENLRDAPSDLVGDGDEAGGLSQNPAKRARHE